MARLSVQTFRVGLKVPAVFLGRLAGDAVETVNLADRLRGRRVILVGVPGAFTPTCTKNHIPAFVAEADALKARGLEVLCVAPNDPWTLDAWARVVDPEGKIGFLSDGNLDLALSLGAMRSERALFLGERPSRYVAVTFDGVVASMQIEPSLAELTCTRPKDALELD